MMKNIMLILIFVFNSSLISAQCLIKIQTYTITDSLFDSVMSEFYTQEQSYGYFDSSICSFSIKCVQDCYMKDTCSYIMLMSGYGKNDTYKKLEYYYNEKDSSVLIVKYKNVLTFVDDCNNCLRPYFSEEPDMLSILYHCPKIFQNKEPVLNEWYEGEDDTYWPNIWICCLSDNNFIVLDKIEGTVKLK